MTTTDYEWSDIGPGVMSIQKLLVDVHLGIDLLAGVNDGFFED